MIETTQTVPVRVGIAPTWGYVQDIRRWAALMPGLQDCQIIDADNSRWVLKVGVGAMVRTVKVDVHVDEWDGPARARFSYKLVGDPVQGSGAYLAVADGPDAIAMTLSLQVVGKGPMAPMWEAMGGPLLPKFARAFAEQLAEGIEAELAGPACEDTTPTPKPNWLRRLWRALFGAR